MNRSIALSEMEPFEVIYHQSSGVHTLIYDRNRAQLQRLNLAKSLEGGFLRQEREISLSKITRLRNTLKFMTRISPRLTNTLKPAQTGSQTGLLFTPTSKTRTSSAFFTCNPGRGAK